MQACKASRRSRRDRDKLSVIATSFVGDNTGQTVDGKVNSGKVRVGPSHRFFVVVVIVNIFSLFILSIILSSIH